MTYISQKNDLIAIITQNKLIYDVLLRASQLNIDNYYVGAGCITQTVWNHISELPLEHGIKDIDFVYYDDHDLSEESECSFIQFLSNEFHDLSIKS